jgi:hypothetical protein
MTKFRTIIKQPPEKDYQAVKIILRDTNAGKSAALLETVRVHDMSDEEIMSELTVNPSAYYALRSRLNRRIEEYLVQQMESPRTNLMKKVSNINEILFTKKRGLAIATLKKLEKDLKHYDLSNELTFVYKSLKKLHVNSPNYFNYSQLYNRHIAYMLATDKAEDLLGDYFKKYGDFILTGDENYKTALNLLKREMQNVCSLYQSHRLYVFNSCMDVFHRLFVEFEENDNSNGDEEPTEDVMKRNEEILSSYRMDTIYYHLNMVFDFLRLCYYNHFNVYRKVESYYEDINTQSPQLLDNFIQYTFPGNFLILKIQRALRLETEKELFYEGQLLYEDLEVDPNNPPLYYIYSAYRALSAYYVDKLDEVSKWINSLINQLIWKKYPLALVEARLMLSLNYYLTGEKGLLKQSSNSIQRQIRAIGKENCEVPYAFQQIIKIAASPFKRDKYHKIKDLMSEIEEMEVNYFSIIKHIRMDEPFLRKMTSVRL